MTIRTASDKLSKTHNPKEVYALLALINKLTKDKMAKSQANVLLELKGESYSAEVGEFVITHSAATYNHSERFKELTSDLKKLKEHEIASGVATVKKESAETFRFTCDKGQLK